MCCVDAMLVAVDNGEELCQGEAPQWPKMALKTCFVSRKQVHRKSCRNPSRDGKSKEATRSTEGGGCRAFVA